MAKNIMLMFISLVPIKDNKISKATYKGIGDTYTTNESATRYVLQSFKNEDKLDRIFAFASKRVLNEQVEAEDVPIDELTGSPMTHYVYFKYRLKNFIDNIASCLTEDNDTEKGSVYPYDEMQLPETINQRAAWKSMGQIVEMASRIQSYIQTVRDKTPNEEVILHVDCTGGPRDAAMMIMGILRLMQYQRITIGKVLYSNFQRGTVDEVEEVYQLFDLIAGAEEFVRFGSVDVIKSYFENRNIPKSLQDLLNAMDKFAEAIKICRRGEFQEALEELQTAYQNFNVAQQQMPTVKDISSLNYNLMQQLESRIGQEYSFLLQHKSDDYLSIIDWCLDHGYLQQAMTLYTECIPYMIVNKDKMITLSEELQIDLYKQVKKDRMNREVEFFLLNDYDPKDYKNIFHSYEIFIEVLKKSILAIRKNSFSMQVFQKDNNLEKWSSEGIIESDFKEYVNLLVDLQKLKLNPELAANEETILKSLPSSHSFISLIPEGILKLMPLNKRAKEIFIKFESIDYNSLLVKQANTLINHYMINTSMLKLNINDEEDFIKIMERYFTIKQERNNSAHALMITKGKLSSQESKQKNYAEILKEYMKEGIQEYLKVRKTIKQ